MNGSNSDNAASHSSTTNTSEPLSSLSGDIEHILQVLEHDVPDDVTDQDIEALLQQLDQANSIGQNVEGKIDAVLSRLDHLLATLQPEGESRTVDEQAGDSGPQKADKDPGR
jgi:hypothetical protein